MSRKNTVLSTANAASVTCTRRIFGVAGVCLALVMCVVCSLFMMTSSAQASSTSNIIRKVLEANIETCYSDTYMKSEIPTVQYTGIRSVLTGSGIGDKVVYLPNGIGNSVEGSTSAVSCLALFEGTSGLTGLNTLAGVSTPSLTDLGFTTSQNQSVKEHCFSYNYGYYSGSVLTQGTTNELCVGVGADGDQLKYNTGESYYYLKGEPSGPLSIKYITDGGGTIEFLKNGNRWSTIGVGTVTTLSGLKKKLDTGQDKTIGNGQEAITIGAINTPDPTDTDHFAIAERTGNAKLAALRYYTGNSEATFTVTRLTEGELYGLYTSYLNDAVRNNSSLVFGSCYATKEEAKQGGNYAVPSGDQWCRIDADVARSVPGSFNIVADRNNGRLKGQLFPALLTALENLDYNAIRAEGIAVGTIGEGGMIDGGLVDDISDYSDGSENTEQDGAELCYTAGAALGWIICPVIDGVGKAADGLYNSAVKPFLEIDAGLLSSDGSSTSTYKGWTTFRDFANIVFVILFLIVIFAQLTGIGISNYNIKKILPRLIVVVVMVNLSFVLCQLAVDLSNIIGNSAEGLLSDLANNVNPGGEISYEFDDILNSIIATLFAVGAAGGAVIYAASIFGSWIMPFLLVLLSCVVGIIFFFIIMGVRQAGVIILVVLAPLAIVCYALPNTKRFFDRWRKMFVGLLVVYPICGVLMGGAKFASALLVSAGLNASSTEEGQLVIGDAGFIYMLVAMLVSVVPFFFIPSLVRSSLQSMGNLGARIAGFGQNLGRRATGAVRSSDRYQDAYRRAKMSDDARIIKRMNNLESRGKTLSDRQRRQLQRARSRYDRAGFEDIRARATGASDALMPGTDSYNAAIANVEAEEDAKAVSNQESLYKRGKVTGVNVDNLDSVSQEHARQLSALNAKLASGKDAKAEYAKVRALQNILSKNDPGRNAIQNNLSELAEQTRDSLHDNQRSAVSMAASHLMNQFGDTYKQKNRGMHKMLADLAAEQYDGVKQGFEESNNVGQGRLRASVAYDGKGLDGYDAASLAGADDGALDRIANGIKGGRIDNLDAQRIAAVANEALSNKNVARSTKAQRRLNEIARASYAAENGSSTLMGASRESLQYIAENIKNNEIKDEERAKIISNIQQALSDSGNTHTVESAAQLNQVLRAAGEREIDPAGLRIDRRGAGGNGGGGDMSPEARRRLDSFRETLPPDRNR